MNKMKTFKRRFSLSVPRTETIEESLAEFTEQYNQRNSQHTEGLGHSHLQLSHLSPGNAAISPVDGEGLSPTSLSYRNAAHRRLSMEDLDAQGRIKRVLADCFMSEASRNTLLHAKFGMYRKSQRFLMLPGMVPKWLYGRVTGRLLLDCFTSKESSSSQISQRLPRPVIGELVNSGCILHIPGT
ncbi:cyclin-dependent kinase 18 [Pelobates cultripes]|uniref:Cyclin-dependent kinase 18 n=1 Tax=Pelobates cultripes TaxID=61616 RepID=A0AAD1R0U3_PELCU|nr:cyclin-dependent kinase 18 [Pelobates cultripes]